MITPLQRDAKDSFHINNTLSETIYLHSTYKGSNLLYRINDRRRIQFH